MAVIQNLYQIFKIPASKIVKNKLKIVTETGYTTVYKIDELRIQLTDEENSKYNN